MPTEKGPYVPQWPLGDRKLHAISSDPHEISLWKLFGVYNGALDVRQKFAAAKAALEKRAREGELGPKGVAIELKKAAAEFDFKLRELSGLHEQAKKYHGEVKARLTARSDAVKSPDFDTAVERGLARDRTIKRFERLEPAKQRAAIGIALEKHDAGFLRAILGESPSLVDEATAKRIEAELMRNSNRGLFLEFQELGGKLDFRGEVDPPTSPLVVSGSVLEDVRNWIEEQAGGFDARTALKRAGVEIGEVAITLTPEQAHDPRLYRSARDVSLAENKLLTITGDEGSGSHDPRAIGGSSNGE